MSLEFFIWRSYSSSRYFLIISLFRCLTHEDSVSFYAMLSGLRTMDYAMKSSGWTVLDIVDDMFENARLRVFSEKGGEREPVVENFN